MYYSGRDFIRATDFVRCKGVVRFSEGPSWEVRLYRMFTCYMHVLMQSCRFGDQTTTKMQNKTNSDGKTKFENTYAISLQ